MQDIYDVINNQEPINEGKGQYSMEAYKEYKKGEREQAYRMIEAATEKIVGSPAELKKYLDLQSRLDLYSVSNVMLILSQYPEASQLRDYAGWQSKNVSVKRGAKGISILEPYPYQRKDGSQGTGYNVKKVFDVSQTMANSFVPQTPRPNMRQVLRVLVEGSPVIIKATEESEMTDKEAIFDRETQTIFVRKGLDEGSFFYNLSKEIANAKLYFELGESTDIKRDLVAESVAYMMAKEFGIEEAATKANPKFLADTDIKTARNNLNLARMSFSQMKNQIHLSVEKERKSSEQAR